MVILHLQDQVHGQVQVQHLPHRQGCPRHPPVHSPGQAAALDRHDRKLISLGQPHKLQDHRTANSAPMSDISAVLTLMMNAVMQGNSNTTAITNALERTTTQFADALQQTIQMGVDAQAQENKNARMDKQFEKIKVFDGSKPSECHPWLEEVHALCIQTGRPFRKMLLLCAGQAVRNFITDMSLEATDDQIKNDPITGYSDLQGLGCSQHTTASCNNPTNLLGTTS